MNGYCPINRAYYGPQQLSDCPQDGYRAIKVYHDGNEISLGGPFTSESDAEKCAAAARYRDIANLRETV